MTSALLVLNAGSSSVKFQLFADQDNLPLLAHGTAADIGKSPSLEIKQDNEKTQIPLPSNATHEGALAEILKWIETHGGAKSLTAAGHRIAHGGANFRQPVKVTPAILADLKKLTPLAPSINRTISRRLKFLRSFALIFRRLPASIRPFICPLSPCSRPMHYRKACVTKASGVLVFMDCPMNGSFKVSTAITRNSPRTVSSPGPSRQWQQHVRNEERQKRRHHNGLHAS